MRHLRYLLVEQDQAFVAQCLDVDIASEGDTKEEAVANLKEALELFFASPHPGTAGNCRVAFGEITLAD